MDLEEEECTSDITKLTETEWKKRFSGRVEKNCMQLCNAWY